MCSNPISQYDKIAIVRPMVKESPERRAHADCCPLLYPDETDSVHDALDKNRYFEPENNPVKRKILHLIGVDIFISQEDDHHVDVFVDNVNEVLKDQYPETLIASSLNRVFDRHGQRVTISLMHSYEEYLKKKELFDKNEVG